MKPTTRRTGLVVRELPEEVLVYDLEQHRAHCLNRTAALVFQHADGTRSAREIAGKLGAQDATEAEEAVRLALAQLAAAGLLEAASEPALSEPAPSEKGLSRREMTRRIGIAAAILLPAVATIVAPTPAEAAATCVNGAGACSGKPDGTPCTCFGTFPCTTSCFGGICQDTPPC
jgi:hypothetical protein